MTQERSTDERWRELMRTAQDGDRAAYDRLLRETVPFLRALARRQIRSRIWAEDAVQDVLLTVHRVRHTYDPERPFKPWLAAIAHRRCIDLLRRRSRTAAYETSDDKAYENCGELTTSGATEEYQPTQRLNTAVDALPAQQREAVELLKLQELSLVEASKITGRSAGALKVNLHRAIKTLRVHLV